MQLDVGLAVGAGLESGGEEASGFFAVDGAAACAGRVAVAGVDLERRAARADAEFDGPLGRRGAVAAPVLFLELALPEGCDLGVDALHPQGVPDPQRLKTFPVGGQIIERKSCD